MPSRSLNIVVLGGPLALRPAAETYGMVRGAALSITTQGSAGPVRHRVEVRDERVAAEVLALAAGVEVQVTGILDLVAGGAVVAVDPRRGCDVQILGGSGDEQPAERPARAVPPAADHPGQVAAAVIGADLAGLSDIANLPDSPERDDDGWTDDAPTGAPAPASPPTPPPRVPAPEVRPAPAAASPAPRVQPQARVSPPAGGARPAPRVPTAPARPPPSPHAIPQPRPETPPLRPGAQAPARDPFARQDDDSDIPF